MSVLVEGSTIVLSGTVGADPYWFFDDGFDASSVILALAEVGADNDVVIRLNSGGGIATEGSAIHAAIAGHRGKTTIVVEGVAASAAFTVAMGGDEIVVSPGAVMMMHDPSGITVGTVVEHEQQIRSLNAMANSMAGVYAARSGDSIDQVRADMVAELWLTPEDAVARKYADRIAGAEADPGTGAEIIQFPAAPEPVPYAYSHYRNPPPRLVAMAQARGWDRSRRPQMAAPPAAPTRQQQEIPMPTTPPAGAVQPDNVVALDAARDEGRQAALVYAREVTDLCALAGQPAQASAFIEKNTAVADVRKALLDARASLESSEQIHARITPEATAPAKPKFDLVANMKSRFG